jgi:hypothetical protein
VRRPFVPAKDFEPAKRFYVAMDFSLGQMQTSPFLPPEMSGSSCRSSTSEREIWCCSSSSITSRRGGRTAIQRASRGRSQRADRPLLRSSRGA